MVKEVFKKMDKKKLVIIGSGFAVLALIILGIVMTGSITGKWKSNIFGDVQYSCSEWKVSSSGWKSGAPSSGSSTVDPPSSCTTQTYYSKVTVYTDVPTCTTNTGSSQVPCYYEEVYTRTRTATQCDNGYYLTNGTCYECEAGYYCEDGKTKTTCPVGSTSETGATSKDDCTPTWTLSLDTYATTLDIGETYVIKPIVDGIDLGANDYNISCVSNNENVATVNGQKITTIAGGNATINVTVTINGISQTKKLIVYVNSSTAPCSKGYYMGENTCMKCTAGYYCSDGSTRTSCPSGKTSDMGATSEDDCYVVNVTGVSVSPSSLELKVGESSQLTATITPSGAANKNVVWSIHNGSGVVSVDQSGNVTALKEGTATVRVTTEDGSYKAESTITVTEAEAVTCNLGYYNDNGSCKICPAGYRCLNNVKDKCDGEGYSSLDDRIYEREFQPEEGMGQCLVCAGPVSDDRTECNYVKHTEVTISHTNLELTIGNSYQLTATVLPLNATYRDVTWLSMDPETAIVDSYGNVTALKEGTVRIVAFNDILGRVDAECVVTVKASTVSDDYKITLNPSSVTLGIGEMKSLKVEASGVMNGTVKSTSWNSNNTGVATVDNSGTITAIGTGAATITAKIVTTTDYVYSATCIVTVKDSTVAVTGVTLDKGGLELIKGESATLVATISPNDATNKKVTWKSNNTNVATVDANGKVTAVGKGETTITVTTADGNKSDYASVTVLEMINLSASISKTTLYYGETAQLSNFKVEYSDGDTKTLSASDVTFIAVQPSVLSISAIGEVTAGNTPYTNAQIRVSYTHAGNTISELITVTVKEKTTTVAVTGVTLDKGEIELIKGESATLVATISPNNATNKKVTWKSNNTNVATVDENGKVTAVGKGETTITVTTADGNKSDSASVIVREMTNLSASISKTTLYYGETAQLSNFKVEYSDGDTKTLSASDVTFIAVQPSVLSISATGVVTAGNTPYTNAQIRVSYTHAGNTISKLITVTVQAPTVPDDYKITLNPSSVTLNIDETKKLKVEASGVMNGTVESTSWTSSNPIVATIDNTGTITAISKGTTTITAKIVTTTDHVYEATCVVTVVSNKTLTSISVNVDNKTGLVGEYIDFPTITAHYDNNTNEDISSKVKWSINSGCASIEGSKLKGIYPGTGTVTASYTYDGVEKTTSFKVTITATTIVSLVNISLSEINIDMSLNQTKYLEVFGTYSDGSTKTISDFDTSNFSSSNDSIKVNKDGDKISVYSQKAGTSTITVTYKGKTTSAYVNVKSENENINIPMTGIYLNREELSLMVGDYYNLSVNNQPNNTTDTTGYYWYSENTDIAVVDQNGKVTGKSVGSTLVWVQSVKYTTMKDCIRVYVSTDEVDNDEVSVTGLSLDKKEIIVKENAYYKINATITPSGATNKTIKWSIVSGNTYATVDSNGLVHALKEGTATLRATSVDNNSIYAECKIIVTPTEGSDDSDTPIEPDEIIKSNVNTLSSLSVNGVGISNFDPYGSSFDVTVPEGTTQVAIDSVLTDSLHSNYVQGYGNRTVYVTDENNSFAIKVDAENGDTRTYTINVTTDTNYQYLVKDINVSKYDINFSNDKRIYRIKYNSEKKLDIEVLLNNNDHVYTIIGNENLVDGSTIMIRVFGDGRVEEYSLVVSSTTGDIEVPPTALNSPVVIILSSVLFIGCGVGIVCYVNNKKRKIFK